MSAMIGCADQIISSLNEYIIAVKNGDSISVGHFTTKGKPEPMNLIDEAIDATETIIYVSNITESMAH